MVRQTSDSISLTFKCQSTAFVLVGTLAVAERVLWNRICLSFYPVCWVVFWELHHYVSLNFGMVLENLIVCVPDFLGNLYLHPKIGEVCRKEAKNRFFLFWDIDWNAVSHSDCGIFKSNISPEQINETASFFACWYKFTKIKSWLKSFW